MHSVRATWKLITTHARRRQIRRQARSLSCRQQPIELEIGAVGHPMYSDGWIVTNLPELDALDEQPIPPPRARLAR